MKPIKGYIFATDADGMLDVLNDKELPLAVRTLVEKAPLIPPQRVLMFLVLPSETRTEIMDFRQAATLLNNTLTRASQNGSSLEFVVKLPWYSYMLLRGVADEVWEQPELAQTRQTVIMRCLDDSCDAFAKTMGELH